MLVISTLLFEIKLTQVHKEFLRVLFAEHVADLVVLLVIIKPHLHLESIHGLLDFKAKIGYFLSKLKLACHAFTANDRHS